MTEDAATPTLSTGGTLTFQDVDLIDTHTAVFVLKSTDATANLPGFDEGNSAAAANIGTFALTPATVVNGTVVESADTINTAAVGWTFTLADNNPTLQSLAKDQTITQVYTVTITDNNGAPVTQDVTVTITGTNDAPTITSTAAAAKGGVTEDAATPTLSTGGTLTFQDVDLTDTHTAGFVLKSTDATANLPGFREGIGDGAANIGTFALDPVSENNSDTTNTGSVGWTFTLADNNPTLQSLAKHQTITQVYTVTITDNNGAPVTQDVTVTITGTNDAPTITSSAQTAEIHEIAHTHNSTTPDTASGAVTFTDVDLIDTHAVTITGVSISGTQSDLADDATVLGWLSLGTLTDSTNGVPGSQAWSFSAQDYYFDYLAEGEHVTLTYTVQVDDHHGGITSQEVTITIDGSNDPAPPVVDLNEDTSGLNNVVHHSPNDVSPILIAQEPTITDVDSPNLVSMTVTLINPKDNSSGQGGAGVNVKETLSLTDDAAALALHDG